MDPEDLEGKVLRMMSEDPRISIATISKRTGVSKNRMERMIGRLKDDGAIRREGGTRGRWVVRR